MHFEKAPGATENEARLYACRLRSPGTVPNDGQIKPSGRVIVKLVPMSCA